MELNNIIYQLRTEKGYTQEHFAEMLGVSTAAVSKWECARAYPDITLLPEIAGIFNVSVDYLLGYDCTKNDLLSEVIAQANGLAKQGRRDESVALLERTLLRYPSNDRLIFEIARHKFFSARFWSTAKRKSRIKEARDGFLFVAEQTDNSNRRAWCYQFLVTISIAQSDYESAEKYNAKLLGGRGLYPKVNQAVIALEKYDNDETYKLLNNNIGECIYEYSLLTHRKISADFKKKDYSGIIRDCSRAIEFLSAYNEDCFGKYYNDISVFYESMAFAYAEMKNYDKCLDCLELACENAIMYDSCDINLTYDTYDLSGEMYADEEKISAVKSMMMTLDSGEREAYNPIKDSEKYREVLKKLTI